MKRCGTVLKGACIVFSVLGLSLGAGAAAYNRMVVFGDSLSDNGNLSAVVGPAAFTQLNYDPFRVTDGPTTTPSTAITGVTVEQLNQMLGLPALAPSNLGGTNYAWAYATTATNSLNLVTGATPGTGTQVAAYLATHPLADPNSLYVMWAGSNDLLAATTIPGIQAAAVAALSNVTTQLTMLVNAGARNILWFDVPDLGATPAAAAQGPGLQLALHGGSELFRDGWLTNLAQLRTTFPNVTFTGVDAFSFIDAVVAQPAVYGFNNVTVPAQLLPNSNPDTSLFWDSLHPTTSADHALAGFAVQQLQARAVPDSPTYGIAALVLLLGVSHFRQLRRRSR